MADQGVSAASEATLETDTEIEQRTRTLTDEANQVFCRFISYVDSQINKVNNLFQIYLVLVSVESAVILFLIQQQYPLSFLSYVLLYLDIGIAFVSFVILCYLVYPRIFRDVEIFDDDRFEELRCASTEELLSDYLFRLKVSYDYNVQAYKRITKWFFYAYVFVVGMIALYVVFIVSIILQI